ncbi:hypothetical protein ACLKA7_013969 [Drosophila subpalustris]
MARYNIDRLMHAGIPECLADHSVSAADLQATTNRPIDKVDVHVKCAVKCILMKMGIVNDFGQLQSEDLFGIFDDPIVKNYLVTPLTACQYIQSPSTCETAFITLLCLKQNTWGYIF